MIPCSGIFVGVSKSIIWINSEASMNHLLLLRGLGLLIFSISKGDLSTQSSDISTTANSNDVKASSGAGGGLKSKENPTTPTLCPEERYGPSCQFTCPPNCLGNCIQETGYCLKCRKKQRWGSVCHRNCLSQNCVDCLIDTGKCAVCENGYNLTENGKCGESNSDFGHSIMESRHENNNRLSPMLTWTVGVVAAAVCVVVIANGIRPGMLSVDQSPSPNVAQRWSDVDSLSDDVDTSKWSDMAVYDFQNSANSSALPLHTPLRPSSI